MATVLPDMPSLTRIERPTGARAAFNQALGHVVARYPHGFATPALGGQQSTRVPSQRGAALWFKELHEAFRSAQGLQFASTPLDNVALNTAEVYELICAAKHPGGPYVDGSMAPRRVAVWLLVPTAFAMMPTGLQLVDAMAQWADNRVNGCRVACKVRMGVATGSTADGILKHATVQGANRYDPCHPGWRIVVRWCDAEGNLQADVADVHGAATLINAVEKLQVEVLQLCARHRLALDGAAVAPVPNMARPHVFLDKLIEIDAEFARFVECRDSVTLSEAAGAAEAAPLENTGVTVRVCDRALGEEGVTSETAFHGVLLGFGGARDDIAAFSNAADPVLPVPLGLDEEAMGLHLCAVHTKAVCLGDAVTLFGLRGRPGAPIHESPPGRSWVWQEAAAIRPVDGSLLASWDLRPCDKASVLPSAAEWIEPYKEHFGRASKLYLSLRKSPAELMPPPPPPPRRTGSVHSELDKMLEGLPTAPVMRDPRAERDNAFMVASLNVDLHSRRTTLGEAYLYLFESGAPAPVRETMLGAMGQLGVRGTLSEMFELCTRTMRAHVDVNPEIVGENARLKRLAAVCFDALHASAPPSKRPAPTPVASNERVRRMLQTLQLKRGESGLLPRGAAVGATCRRVAQVVVRGAQPWPLASDNTEQLAADALEKLAHSVNGAVDEQWGLAIELAIARIAWMTLKSVELGDTNRVPPPCFMISTTVGAASMRIERISTDDAPEAFAESATFDDMMGCAAPLVLLVQLQDGGARVTATLPVAPKAPANNGN